MNVNICQKNMSLGKFEILILNFSTIGYNRLILSVGKLKVIQQSGWSIDNCCSEALSSTKLKTPKREFRKNMP
jgi:hypothetical protein